MDLFERWKERKNNWIEWMNTPHRIQNWRAIFMDAAWISKKLWIQNKYIDENA